MNTLLSSPGRDIAFDRVSFAYPGARNATLREVDWRIDEGDFVLLAGPSGSGKSTLLRCLNGLVPHFSGGRFGGAVTVRGLDTRRFGPRVLSGEVGFVFQEPEAQRVAATVDDELAFGMEQLGVAPVTMRKRVEEVLDLLGIAALRDRDLGTLSGGERQRVAVAAALTLQPRVLVLDEPTSQLDPWGAEDVVTALDRLNGDLGLTIVLAEHRLERVIGVADRMRALDVAGGIVDGTPREVLAALPPEVLPPIARLGRALEWLPLPLTIKEGRSLLRANGFLPDALAEPANRPGGAPVIACEWLSAGYGRRSVLRDLSLEIRPGELVALMGRNGSGKTTLLRTLMGFHRPTAGRVTVAGLDAAKRDPAEIAVHAGYLPQRPGSLLFCERVEQELAFTLRHRRGGRDPEETLALLGLTALRAQNPRDLSVGEQERAALAAVLVGDPRVLLLDEPTRGMDYRRKRDLAAFLRARREEGVAIVMATHDVELVAGCATRVVLLGEGEVVADGTPREVLSGSLTFATQINKLFGDRFLTVEDVLGATASAMP